MQPPDTTLLYQGKFLSLFKTGKWEYAKRPGDGHPVAILAVTPENKLLLISQFRIPVQKTCVEIPAGLVGDTDTAESWQTAACRELEEETGYTAAHFEKLAFGPTSAGLTSECITFCRATNLKKLAAARPDGDEQITIHEVPLNEIDPFLQQQSAAGNLIDPKVYAALYFLTK